MLPQQSGQRMSHCHNDQSHIGRSCIVLVLLQRQCDAPKTHLVVSARPNRAPAGRSRSTSQDLVCHSSPGLNAAYANLFADSSTWQIFNQPGEWRVKKHCHSKDLCSLQTRHSVQYTCYPLPATRYTLPAMRLKRYPFPFTAAAQLVARGLLITALALSHLLGKHWQMFPHALAFPYPLPFRLPPGAILNPLAHHILPPKSQVA